MVIIVGGGITGLSAAFELARRGMPFILLEREGRAGGLIRTERIDGFTIDAGPDSLLAAKPAALQLCEELGLGARLMGTTPPRTAYVLKKGRLHALPSPSVLGIPTTMRALAGYDLLGWRERARVAVEPLIPPGPGSDESVAAFFRRRFGPATVNLVAEPLLGGIHAGDIEALSICSLFPRLPEAERKPGRVLRNLGTSSPPDPNGLFRALRGGMGELVDTLLAALPGGSVALAAPAASLERHGRGWRLASEAAHFDAPAVILAAPASVGGRLLAPLDPEAARLCASVPYVSTASVALGWRRADIPHPLAGSGFVVSRPYNALRVTACTWVSSKWDARAPEGCALLRAFLGGAHDPDVVALGDEALIEVACRDVTRTLGITAPPLLARAYRSPQAGAQHLVGHQRRMAALSERLRTLPGVFVAGSGYEAIGIPDCVAHGRRVASRAAEYVNGAKAVRGS